jgi:transcriptional regulator with XRE-family HTH domain
MVPRPFRTGQYARSQQKEVSPYMKLVSSNSSTLPRPRRALTVAADPIDIHVGRRIKLRRALLKISQEELGADIGVTFQQIQKYESGGNRVSASRLYDVGRVLNCPITYFFDDIKAEDMGCRPMPAARSAGGAVELFEGEAEADPMQRTETLQLARAYWRLSNEALRRSVLSLMENMSSRE